MARVAIEDRALGLAEDLGRQLEADEMAQVAGTYVAVYPNAGLPNEMGGYDETPDTFAGKLKPYA